MRGGALLLALCLGLSAAATAAAFCEGAAAAGSAKDGEWELLPELADGGAEVPESVLNATLAAFDEQRVPGLVPNSPADALPQDQHWVPCSAAERDVVAMGCRKDAAEGEEYQLMLAIECAHQGHDDLANLTATATVSADGSIKVELGDVQLDVHEFHTEMSECTLPFCVACNQAEAVDGRIQGREECVACDADYVLEEGACRHVNGTESIRPGAGPDQDGWEEQAAKGQAAPTGDATAPAPLLTVDEGSSMWNPWDEEFCPQGYYKADGTAQGACVPCTNPGCNLATINQGTDCVHCWPQQGNCVNSQWCRAPCAYGFFWRAQQCYPCSQTIANCANCVACSMGKACHSGGAMCTQCMPGYQLGAGGQGYCLPIGWPGQG